MDEALDYIRRKYGVPARRGARVRYTGGRTPVTGRITSGRESYIRVRFDNATRPVLLHPTWCVEYIAADTEA